MGESPPAPASGHAVARGPGSAAFEDQTLLDQMMQHVRHLVLGRAEIVGYLLAAQRHAGLCDAVQGHFFERLSGVRRQLGGCRGGCDASRRDERRRAQRRPVRQAHGDASDDACAGQSHGRVAGGRRHDGGECVHLRVALCGVVPVGALCGAALCGVAARARSTRRRLRRQRQHHHHRGRAHADLRVVGGLVVFLHDAADPGAVILAESQSGEQFGQPGVPRLADAVEQVVDLDAVHQPTQ